MKKIAEAAVLLLAVTSLLIGCASSKAEAPAAPAVPDEADKVVVVDWTDRNLGVESTPKWLIDMKKGNSDTFKEQFGIDSSRIVKISNATGVTEAQAQALSRVGFSYTQASELNQKVIGRVGQGLDDKNQLDALFLAASETKAEMTGLREETSFFQKVRTTEFGADKSETKYIYYTVYSMDKETWDNMCKKYLLDLMGYPQLETETQKKIGALFSEIKDDADKKDLKKQQEEAALYKLQMARIEAEASAPKDAKDAQTKASVDEANDLASFLM